MDLTKDCIEQDFSFFMPCTLEKSKSSDGDGEKWIITGVAATEDEDHDSEVMLMDGMDISYLQKNGYFNWNHKGDPDDLVGEITEAKKHRGKLVVKGFLYKTKEKARKVYEHMQTLKSESGRSMGFSVEGKVILKAGKHILKSWIKAIAVTHEPVNSQTLATLGKSLSAQLKEVPSENKTVEKSYDGIPVPAPMGGTQINGLQYYSFNSGNGGWRLLTKAQIDKALDAPTGPAVDGSTGGTAITREDLEQDTKKKKKKLKITTYKGLVDEIARLRPNYSKETCERVAQKLQQDKEEFIDG